MVDISFLMITNRPFELYAKKTCNFIRDAIDLFIPKYSYEIVIVSPHEIKPDGDDVKIVVDPENIDGRGAAAYNLGYKHTSGRFISIMNDDRVVEPKILRVISLLDGPYFRNRKYKVTSLGASSVPQISCLEEHMLWNCYCTRSVPNLKYPPQHDGLQLSAELSKIKYLEFPHRYTIFGYPVFEKETIDNYLDGVVFNPRFKHHYADNWLPYWLGEMGEYPITCLGTELPGFGGPESSTDNDAYDYGVFVNLVDNFVAGVNCSYGRIA